MQVRVDCAVVHDTVSIFSVQCICITNHCAIAMMFVCPSVCLFVWDAYILIIWCT